MESAAKPGPAGVNPGVRLLSRSDVLRLLPLADCVDAVAAAFLAHAQGTALGTVVAGLHAGDGTFHLKAAGLGGPRAWFAAKLNANYPSNPARNGQPTIQGLVMLADAGTGRPLAVMDTASITLRRTAAATALAARHLARADAAVATVVGCGVQGPEQLRALALVRPLERAFVLDPARDRAEACARALTMELGIPVSAVGDLERALQQSLVCVTCTPADRPVLGPEMVPPGMFIAAVGADNEAKNEIHPALLARSRVVTDLTSQASRMGDLHHALEAGAMRLDQVHAELAQILAGVRPGREDDGQIIVFDSTGTALQDVAAAALVFQRAETAGAGTMLEFDR